MAEDAAARRIGRDMAVDQRRQLGGHVRIHPVMLRPWRGRRIDIKSGAGAEIIRLVLAGQAEAARAGIRGDEDQAVFGGIALGTGLGGRSEEHTSELQSLMRISYAVFCLKKKKA